MSPNTILQMRTVPGSMAGLGAAAAAHDAAAFDVLATAQTLPEGAQLLDYEIIGPIGEGGFGIVYLAWDRELMQHVAIKEYLPSAVASRANVSNVVVVKSQRHADSFRLGLDSFVNEARMLARFDHASLVKVLRFWEGNGTAYMAMPYYEGPTLARALAERAEPPGEGELRGWLRPLLDALSVLHAACCYHRDLAPDNILLTDDGPVLLDLGAARHVIAGMTHAPTVVLKPGFAPVEQYGEVPSMRQGPWTDLYALAAVVYMALTGKPPMPAVERMLHDRLQPLSEVAPGACSPAFAAAIDAALALYPKDRPQSVAEFWALLNGWVSAPRIDEPAVDVLATTAPALLPPPGPVPAVGRHRPAYALAATLVAIGLAATGYHYLRAEPGAAAPQEAMAPAAPSTAAAAAPPVAKVGLTAATPAVPAVEPALPATGSAVLDREVVPAAAVMAALALDEVAPPPPPVAVSKPPARTLPRVRREARPTPADEFAPMSASVVWPEEAAPTAAPVTTGSTAPTVPAPATRDNRCSDVLQRASIEPLTAAEAAFVRKECQP